MHESFGRTVVGAIAFNAGLNQPNTGEQEEDTQFMATLPGFKTGYWPSKTSERDSLRFPEVNIISEGHFNRMLQLERKRTERSDKPFLLVLLDGAGLFQGDAGDSMVPRLIAGLDGNIRETDSVGWYREGRVVGILFTEFGYSDCEFAAGVISRKVTSAVREALGEELATAVEITLHIFPETTPRKKAHGQTHHEAESKFYREFAAPQKHRGVAGVVKRSIDVAGSLAALVALSPVFLVVMLLVKMTSKGPILFRQRRVGQYGRSFTFLKFRSMFVNCDSKIHQDYVTRFIAGEGNLKQPTGSGGAAFKLTNDPRVTPVGRFLRRTSLDELPQFLNVLMGEMSLVGPRPPVPYEFERYGLWHRRRVMEVKPGITGLWQVMGRSRTSFDEMVRLDLKYARVWSLWLDLKILCLTPKAMLSGDGAY